MAVAATAMRTAPWVQEIQTLVFAGGGPKLLAAISALLKLRDVSGADFGVAGSPTHVFVGSSMGVLLAALLCMGLPTAAVATVVRGLQPDDFVSLNLWTAWRSSGLGLDDGDRMERLLVSLLARHLHLPADIAATMTLAAFCDACTAVTHAPRRRQLHIVVTELWEDVASKQPTTAGEQEGDGAPRMRSGCRTVYLTPETHPDVRVVAALRTSMGFPGLFLPTDVTRPGTAGIWCVDGGVTDNYAMHAYDGASTLGFLFSDAAPADRVLRGLPPPPPSTASTTTVACSCSADSHTCCGGDGSSSDEGRGGGGACDGMPDDLSLSPLLLRRRASSGVVVVPTDDEDEDLPVATSPPESTMPLPGSGRHTPPPLSVTPVALRYVSRLLHALSVARDIVAWHALTPTQQLHTIVIPVGGVVALTEVAVNGALSARARQVLCACGAAAVEARVSPDGSTLLPQPSYSPLECTAEPAAWPAFVRVATAALQARASM